MKVTIQPSQLKGNIQAPASKSSMQRACAAALLTKGTTNIHNPGHSNDDKAAVDIIQRLGAIVENAGGQLSVVSAGFPPDRYGDTTHLPTAIGTPLTIDCGESGLSIRMFTPLAALSDKEITISGSGSLLTRPMTMISENK